MKILPSVLLLFACLPLASTAQEEGPVDELPGMDFLASLDNGWGGCERGGWVELRLRRREGEVVTERTEKRALKGLEKDGTAMVSVTGPGGSVLRCVEDEVLRTPAFQHEKFDTIDIEGMTLQCQVWSNHASEAAKAGGEKLRIWIVLYVATPGSVVKSERVRADGSTVTRVATGLNRFVEVAGRRVLCSRFRELETLANGAGTMETEELESPDVPGGIVSRRGKGVAGKAEVEVSEEVTAFQESATAADDAACRGLDAVRARFRFYSSPWTGFAAGTTVLTRIETHQSDGDFQSMTRTTIDAVRPGGVAVTYAQPETWHLKSQPGTAAPGSKMEWPTNSGTSRQVSVKRLGRETMTACGKDWDCETYMVAVRATGAWNCVYCCVPEMEYRVWRCPSFPAQDGVVRVDNGWRTPGKETVMTQTRVVADLDRVCRIGGRDFHCRVDRIVEDDDRAEQRMDSEEWWSEEMPGGLVRLERWTIKGGKRDRTVLSEVVEADVRKAK